MNQFKEFYGIFSEVWNQGFLGINIAKLINISLILIFFLWFRNKFTKIILSKISKLAEKINAKTAFSLINNLEEPVKMIPLIIGIFFVLDYIGFKDGALKLVGERTIKTLISCNIFWAVYVSVAPLSKFLNPLKKIFTTEIINWLVKTIKFFILFFCVATTLEIWGVNVGALIAGLGLLGIAGALGAQDLVKNLISGVLILVEKRFHIGDWILVDGLVEGTVEEIGFRSTLIRRFDKAPVFVPNTKLADAAVTNFTKMTYRRIFFILVFYILPQLTNLKTFVKELIII
ncbi:MAG: Low conductance mechanosensitive channel YnaI [Alphaproteobacteria bacterium ADurb.Bin438]|nr:MAG: Low conductance mechanosensitive channel YnaI [Alphaproteobacteria bacterium ADurb.Bin438]